MAVTVVSNQMVQMVPVPVAEIELSGLTAGATETIAFPVPGRPDKVPVRQVELGRVKTQATSFSPVILGTWASDESSNQFTCKFETETGGDLAGAVVVLRVSWLEQARQDGQSISSDNDT